MQSRLTVQDVLDAMPYFSIDDKARLLSGLLSLSSMDLIFAQVNTVDASDLPLILLALTERFQFEVGRGSFGPPR